MADTSWHTRETGEVYRELGSSEKGLSTREAEERLEKEGLNQLETKKQITPLKILKDQFKDFLILLLIAAAIISIGIGLAEQSVQEIVEAALILVIVVFIVVVGFYQQYHAEKELEALKNLMTPQATVLRDGEKEKIDATQLATGDIVYLEAGDRVPADLRIIKSIDLRVDESSLTGESTPVDKKTGKLQAETPLAERENMLYMSTNVVYGKATGIVAEKAMDTELGKIAGSMEDIQIEKTPLQERLEDLGKQIGIGVIILCAIVFLAGILAQAKPPLEMFIVAVALAVAAVPEGLPGVVTVALASGTRRMVKENAIIRKLPAVETLGSTNVICTDKTGTLTKNEMTVKEIWVDEETIEIEGEGYDTTGAYKTKDGGEITDPSETLDRFLEIGVLCNDAELTGDGIRGDPTQASMVVAGEKIGYTQKKLNEEKPRVDEIPFSSERKRETTIHETREGLIAYSLGAPDVILESCSKILIDGVEKPLTEEYREKIEKQNADFASQAYRILGLAYRRISEDYNHQNVEQEMVFTGLAAMIDPPRPESRESVKQCQEAGIRVVMVTGDHQLTAKAIASDLGIYHEGEKILTGPELEKMSDQQLKEVVDDVSVYARVSPLHKLRIVEALQAKDNVVAVTGDGVNDAPALKKADIGVSMALTGTDVSREASDMVLTDDNFASIVKAVEEGRGIYDNIKKFFAYLISGNIGEVAVVFLSSVIGSVPVALTASQILIINLVTDAFPALALGVDPFEPGAMKRKPRPKDEPLHKGLSPFIAWYPLLMIAVTMGLFLWVWDPKLKNIIEAQTIAFLTINLFESYQGFAARSTRYPSLKVGLFKNKWLVLAIIFSVVILPVFLYVPIPMPFTSVTLQDLAHFYPIPASEFLLVFLLSSLGFIYLEIHKWYNTRDIQLSGEEDAVGGA